MKIILNIAFILSLSFVTVNIHAEQTNCEDGPYSANLCCSLMDGGGDPSNWRFFMSTGAKPAVSIKYDPGSGTIIGAAGRNYNDLSNNPKKLTNSSCVKKNSDYLLTLNWDGPGLKGKIQASVLGLENFLPVINVTQGVVNNHPIKKGIIFSDGYDLAWLIKTQEQK